MRDRNKDESGYAQDFQLGVSQAWRQRQVGLCANETSQLYTVSSKPARAT